MLVVLPLAISGCSGVNATGSVSPASFLLPGLMKNDAPFNPPTLTPEVSTKIAVAR
jgi:hypothetical protein